MKKPIAVAAAIAVVVLGAGITLSNHDQNAQAQDTFPPSTTKVHIQPAERPIVCDYLDWVASGGSPDTESDGSTPRYGLASYADSVVASECPEHNELFVNLLTTHTYAARPNSSVPVPTASPTWTQAPAPASMLDYEYSTKALQGLWDSYTQDMRNQACEQNFWMKYGGLDDMYDDQAVADFEAQVC